MNNKFIIITNFEKLNKEQKNSLEEKIGQALAEMYKVNQEKEIFDKRDVSVKFN